MATTARRPIKGQQALKRSPTGLSVKPSPDGFKRLREQDCLASILQHLEALKSGETSVRLPASWTGVAGKIAESFNQIALSQQQMASELRAPRMYEQLLSIASEAVLVRALDNTILYWNPGAEKLYGWRREEVHGKDIHSLLRTVFPVSRQQIDSDLQEHKSRQGSLIQTTKGGTEIIVACRKSLNHAGDAVLEVGRDITAELRAEEIMRDTEKLAAMGRVAGIIAHEISNPLAAITNILFLLRNHPSLDAEALRCADLAQEELERVSEITRQTLTFYRESRHPIPVALPELLEDVLGLQGHALKGNRIALRTRFYCTAHVLGFPVELRQVFLNLIGNAIQAMPNGGTLSVRVRQATDWTTRRRGIMISILDTGKGVAPHDAPHLFEPFYSTKSTQGTGLGLWISKGIVLRHDGKISFRSYRRMGTCATCFRVFLPVSDTPSPSVGSSMETADSQIILPGNQSSVF